MAAFWQQARPYRWWLLVVVSLTVFAYGTEMLEPWVAKFLIDTLTRGPAVWSGVAVPFGLFVLMRATGWVSWRVADAVTPRFRPRMESAAREHAFDTALGRSFAYFSDTPSGSVVHYVSRFVDAFLEFVDIAFFNVAPIALAVVSTLISVWLRSRWLALGFAAWMVVLVLVQLAIAKRQTVLRREVNAVESKISAWVADSIGNAPTIKTFATERRESRGLRRILDTYVGKESHAWLKENWYWGAQSVCFLALEIGLVGGVVYGWTRGTFGAGDLVLVQSYVVLLYRFLGDLTRVFRRLPRLFGHAEEMVELMRTPPEILDAPGAAPLRVADGRITFDRVSFAYKTGRPILKDFALDINPGQKVAFVGPSGAGKSTVVKLLERFYDIQRGAIRIDGQDIAQVTQDSLRGAISLVPQDPVLFHRTILDNIRYGRPSATEAQVVAAARRAHCHEFITKLPKGYQTLVGERGVKLSGGERQRVAIARAILRDAPILLLDEATSALDSQSEALIQEALRELMRGKTVLVIAHRLSTIMEMDRIIVVEKGRVSDDGTHDELLRREGTYRKLWLMQSGGYIQE